MQKQCAALTQRTGMTKHTTGPWAWQEGTPTISCQWNGRYHVIAGVECKTLAWHEDANCAGREAGANARLIAAAPDLLDVLKELAALDFGAPGMNDDERRIDFVARKARAAIAKATGEAK